MSEAGPHIKSGIVLYPETGSLRDMSPALARQFGMATNAYVEGKEVYAGTAHAIGYDPELAIDLSNLYGPLNIHDKALHVKERVILDKFDRLIATELSAQDVALESLGNVLNMRRLDIIVPPEVAHTAGLESSLPYIPRATLGRTVARVWRKEDTGVYVAASKASIDRRHPLSNRNLEGEKGRLVEHKILTADATLQPHVQERATYQTAAEDTGLCSVAPGYQRTVYRKSTALHEATFTIPVAKDSPVLAEWRQLDTQNAQVLQEYEDAATMPNSDVDAYWVDGGTQSIHAAYLDRTEVDRSTLVRMLDPLDDANWHSRLN